MMRTMGLLRKSPSEPAVRAAAQHQVGFPGSFEGLWTDRIDFDQELARRIRAGAISPTLAEQLRHWRENGYVVIEQAIHQSAIDRFTADLDEMFEVGDERLLIQAPDDPRGIALTPGHEKLRNRVVDVYAYYESARSLLFAPPIVEFMSAVFDDKLVCFQSLTFETGSGQGIHQDTAYVVVDPPLAVAAAWIALEDVTPGSGELEYIPGSHHLSEYLFSGAYKHYDSSRDQAHEHQEWAEGLIAKSASQGLSRQRFLPKAGDVLIWAADLVHGGAPIEDSSKTRRSLVGHYCPARAVPYYYDWNPERRKRIAHEQSLYSSGHYDL